MKLVNQQVIKNNNLKTLYHFIQHEPGVSRAQLAKLSGLSKTTVSTLVDELIARNFIQDTGILDDCATVGRKPNGLQLFHGQYYAVVISFNERESTFIARATAIFFGLCASAFLPSFLGGLFWRRMVTRIQMELRMRKKMNNWLWKGVRPIRAAPCNR
ncbi:MAG: winged helix-turn-helix transcriptional regulator [Clostridia bacterium]|nr:winged helix-turn-helix transcriptional regulator [Clostridia bacterium]